MNAPIILTRAGNGNHVYSSTTCGVLGVDTGTVAVAPTYYRLIGRKRADFSKYCKIMTEPILDCPKDLSSLSGNIAIYSIFEFVEIRLLHRRARYLSILVLDVSLAGCAA